MPAALRTLPRSRCRSRPSTWSGSTALRALLDDEAGGSSAGDRDSPMPVELPPPLARSSTSWPPAEHGLIMVMGKGGVGKTTIAAAIAVELATRGHPRPPQHDRSRGARRGDGGGEVAHLQVSRIDPAAETKALHRARHGDAGRGPRRGGPGAAARRTCARPARRRSRCSTRSRAWSPRRDGGFVVLDTAPTGHTLLLLDATGAYHRDVTRGLSPSGREPASSRRSCDCRTRRTRR